MACSPATNRIIVNPIWYQMIISISDGSACDVLVMKSRPSKPRRSSTPLKMPLAGSSSSRQIAVTTTIDMVTGENTMVRMRRIPRCEPRRAIASANASGICRTSMPTTNVALTRIDFRNL